ncbi:hypothetical protein EJB05_45412, partial [Eragrostis curvula]
METVDVAIHAHAEETTTKTPKSQDPEEIVGQSPEEPQHPPQPPPPLPTFRYSKSNTLPRLRRQLIGKFGVHCQDF